MEQVEPDKPRIVIIGAGMAGLAAALRLVETGMFEVVVMEAMDRPGGRIHTVVEDFGSEVIELGANWIHGSDGNPLYELAREHNLLMMQDPDYGDSSNDSSSSSSSNISGNGNGNGNGNSSCSRNKIDSNYIPSYAGKNIHIREDGTIVPIETIQKICQWYSNISVESANVDSHAGCSTVEEYFRLGFDEILTREGILDGEDLHLHRLVIRWLIALDCVDMSHSSSKSEVALLHFNDYYESPGEYFISLGKKGFRGVVDLFVNALPADTIKYSSPVEQIVWKQANSKKPVVIHAKDHLPITADHVIITASIGFLKENHLELFQPALPADKQRAVETLGFGTVDKIFLKYKEPFWKNLRDGGLDGIQLLWEKCLSADDVNDDNFMSNVTGFDTVDKHADTLCAWVGGKEAKLMETLTDDQVAKACTDVLRKFLKTDVPLPSQVLISRWHSNPYFKGGYHCYLPIHGTGEEYEVMSRPICEELDAGDSQIPVLLFAGEGCIKRFQGTVHGAMKSGEQQADCLIDVYRRDKAHVNEGL